MQVDIKTGLRDTIKMSRVNGKLRTVTFFNAVKEDFWMVYVLTGVSGLDIGSQFQLQAIVSAPDLSLPQAGQGSADGWWPQNNTLILGVLLPAVIFIVLIASIARKRSRNSEEKNES